MSIASLNLLGTDLKLTIQFMFILVIFLAYDRIPMLIENIKRFGRNGDLLDSIVVVWNHPDLKPESYTWPSTPFPIHVRCTLHILFEWQQSYIKKSN